MTDDGGAEFGLTARTSDVTCDVDDGERYSRAVVRAVATLRDEPEVELAPLYESVDPDALDGLFEHPVAGGADPETTVTFRFGGCRATVTQTAVHVRTLSDTD